MFVDTAKFVKTFLFQPRATAKMDLELTVNCLERLMDGETLGSSDLVRLQAGLQSASALYIQEYAAISALPQIGIKLSIHVFSPKRALEAIDRIVHGVQADIDWRRAKGVAEAIIAYRKAVPERYYETALTRAGICL